MRMMQYPRRYIYPHMFDTDHVQNMPVYRVQAPLRVKAMQVHRSNHEASLRVYAGGMQCELRRNGCDFTHAIATFNPTRQRLKIAVPVHNAARGKECAA